MTSGGQISYIIHRVEDVTEFVRLKHLEAEQQRLAEELQTKTSQMEYEIFARAQEVQKANRQLEEANQQLASLYDELKAQAQRLEEASRLKSEFLANMSHELRTPLNGIIGLSELMYDGRVGALSAEHKDFMEDILASARHLLHLINDVLDLSAIEAGRIDFYTEETDPAALVHEVCEVLRTFAAKKRISVKCVVDPSLRDVQTDQRRFKQILYNYVSNALKFTPEGGAVTVHVRPDEETDYFRLEVEDTGIGIKTEDVDRLFVNFQQLDATMAKKYAGTGLGLALTKKIVESQGGRVGVTSTMHQGTVFYAILPKTAKF